MLWTKRDDEARFADAVGAEQAHFLLNHGVGLPAAPSFDEFHAERRAAVALLFLVAGPRCDRQRCCRRRGRRRPRRRCASAGSASLTTFARAVLSGPLSVSGPSLSVCPNTSRCARRPRARSVSSSSRTKSATCRRTASCSGRASTALSETESTSLRSQPSAAGPARAFVRRTGAPRRPPGPGARCRQSTARGPHRSPSACRRRC